MCVGVCRIRHGYGACRGTPVGRHSASGSSFDRRSSVTFNAQSWMGKRLARLQRIVDVVDELPVGSPDAREVHLAVCRARSRRRGAARFGVFSASPCASARVGERIHDVATTTATMTE